MTGFCLDTLEGWAIGLAPAVAAGVGLGLLAGFAVATLVGVGLGVAIGSSPRLRATLEPVLEFLRAIPPPCWCRSSSSSPGSAPP